MPAPIPDLSRDQQCHNYQAPSGQRCGSPAMKSEYYCYHHLVKHNYKKNYRVLIDPEITGMEIPPIEDRASIFYALAAVIHRLAENTIDTRRAGQMIYGLQVAMRALEPPPSPRCRTTSSASASSATTSAPDHPEVVQSATTPCDEAPVPPKTIQITKESLLYFLRSRHCYNCNTELFPAHELTERRNAGAPAEIIEEARHALPAPEPLPSILHTLNAATSKPCRRPRTSTARPRTRYLEPAHQSTFAPPFALHSPRRSVSLRLGLRLYASQPQATSGHSNFESADKQENQMAAVDEKVKQIIVEQLQVDEAEVTPGASFQEDLGADSLDVVELVMQFEEAFDIQIPDEDAEKIKTVKDAVDYIEKTQKAAK